MKKILAEADIETFQYKLADYKQLIDADIAAYTKQLKRETLQEYGANSRLEIDAFLDILQRGGKRIRGALTIMSYEMCGGVDKSMIVQAARAIEMIHAYILIVDDFQDRSNLRRGGKAAHVILADYHRQHELAGNSEHFGASVAWNAALVGNHTAQIILSNLNVDAEVRNKVLRLVNKTMVLTGHGQTNDIMNEVVGFVSEDDVERAMEWKTAYYTLLTPLQTGMILAGSDDHALDTLKPYAIHAGKAFQITDDIIGTFGSAEQLGKSPVDDIREGKRTLLVVYALEHASVSDKNFLIQTLGNNLISPSEFERCKVILQTSGALEYAKSKANIHAKLAIKALNKTSRNWSAESTEFLHGFAQYLLQRQT